VFECNRMLNYNIISKLIFFCARFLLGLLFYPEDRDGIFVRNVGLSRSCTLLQSKGPVKIWDGAILHVELLRFLSFAVRVV
jgi:hypothetical protein